MARSAICTTLPRKAVASSLTLQPLTTENLRKYTKTVAVSSRKHKVPRSASPERTFICQDKNYPRGRKKPPRPIQNAYASSGPSVHWCGDDRALFELDPAAKYNIRDYLLEQCKAVKQTNNELTKPTGTRVVFVLRFNVDDAEQEALCVQTDAATLHGIYSFRNVHPSMKKASAARKMSTSNTKNAVPRRLPRSRGTTSLTRLMASANEEGFPLPDRELDSDSDENQDEAAPPPYTAALDTITEGDEDEKADAGFINVVDIGAPKFCHDPDSVNHPECYGRYKADSFAHNVVDAELDFQERFVTAHSGYDSAADYRNWRVLKHDYGATMVHGQSSLRNPVASPAEETGDGEESVDDLVDATDQLLRLIDKKYGPLTLEGQKAKPEPATNCSDECIAKVTEYLDRDPEGDPWLPGSPFGDGNEDIVSEPITLFEGVADLSDDEVPAPASTPTFAHPKRSNAPVMTEDELEKLINTSHEDFVNNYVQRCETMRINATRAKQVREQTYRAPVPSTETKDETIVAPDTTVEQVLALPELVVTPATPVPSPVKDTTPSTDLAAGGQESAPDIISEAPLTVPKDVSQQTVPAQSCDVAPATPPAVSIGAMAPQVLPVLFSYEKAMAESMSRPASASSFCSSQDGSSVPASVFSGRASVATKPSNESFAFGYPRLVDTLDLQVDIKPGPTTVSHHERSASMPILTFSSPNTSETSIDVSGTDQSTCAQATYVEPSTPVRATAAANKCLTPIIEVQTPLSSSTMPPTTIHASDVMDDTYDDFPTPNFHYPQPHVHMPPRTLYVWRDEPVAHMPTSVFIDDSSLTDRRPRSNKFTAGIKYRARAVAGATKQAARRIVRSVKKMRTTTQYFVPMTFGSCNLFETMSRR